MRRIIGLLAVTFLFVPSGIAHQQEAPCRIRFAVVQRSDLDTWKLRPDNSGTWGAWPGDASKWWFKDGSKKLVALCPAARNDADFVLAWESMQITRTIAEAINKTELQPYTERVCYPSGDGTTQQCEDYTAYREVQTVDWEYHDQQLERTSVTLYRVGREPQTLTPVSRIAKERLPGLNSGKAAFQSAMKALRKQAKKPAAAQTK